MIFRADEKNQFPSLPPNSWGFLHKIWIFLNEISKIGCPFFDLRGEIAIWKFGVDWEKLETDIAVFFQFMVPNIGPNDLGVLENFKTKWYQAFDQLLTTALDGKVSNVAKNGGFLKYTSDFY